MNILITFLGLAALTFILCTGFLPLQVLKEKIKNDALIYFLDCCLCMGFWIGILYFYIDHPITTFNLLLIYNMFIKGAIVSILAESIRRIEKYFRIL